MDYKIEFAKTEDLYAIHKIIYNRCLWFREKGVKGWNVVSIWSTSFFAIIKYSKMCL